MFGFILFGVMLLFVLAYYFAFEYCRYRTAQGMAGGLGGAAVFRLGGSYMRCGHDGVEERAWIVPDDKMAWGSILSAFRPSASKLFLRRDKGPGFRFHIEYNAGMLSRTIFLGALKEAEFHVPRLDEHLRLRTDDSAAAASYFMAPERQEALTALFLAGFIQLQCNRGVIVATMQGVSAADLSAEKIALHLEQLRRL